MQFLRRLFFFALLLTTHAHAAESVSLRVMALPDNRHLYYTKLLEAALRNAGYEPRFEWIATAPQARIWRMLSDNDISLMWGVQTTERDTQFASVTNNLTNGLIGQRVFLVKQGQEGAYASVRSLDDLRALGKVGGVGTGWFDAELWQLNKLPVLVKAGDWRLLFRMVASGDRNVDYVVRGINEIVNEARDHPGLAIESHLILMHDRDMRFYLSPAATRYKSIIERALAQADLDGLKKRTIAQYILPELETLQLDKRVKLKLVTPAP
ncbi:hypothetical protein VVD49_12030 [Uliginosibacterium sp. H3]|uniref:Solute-binding protein family 3/N-terminal domain-containing protein n=1 Tax=Uliginosibacterium silvisoli TaxID=3114758 RepID=A0ABU6K4X0_9RHOO|nr:hypothetical protein [Uliginosibacterium sp. H3]